MVKQYHNAKDAFRIVIIMQRTCNRIGSIALKFSRNFSYSEVTPRQVFSVAVAL